MAEDLPLEDLPKDDDNDDEDNTIYQGSSTSTSIDQGYLGYSEYMAERKRLQWEIKNEEKKPTNIRERDEEYDRMRDARQQLKRYLPNYVPNDSTFNVRFGADGSIEGKLSIAGNNVWHTIIDKDGVIKLEDLPKTMRKALGSDYETMLNKYNDVVSQLNEEKEKHNELLSAVQGIDSLLATRTEEIGGYVEREKELREFIEKQQAQKAENKNLFDQTVKQNIELKIQAEKLLDEVKLYKEEIDKYKKGKSNSLKLVESNERLQDEVDKLKEQLKNKTISIDEQLSGVEGRKDEILKNLPLRERLKYIFKKYGFTVFAVLSAVGVIIGVIVSNLSKGLSALGRGVGNGLKTIGKKLGEILPGMVGAIVSFLFKTAGQVIGFLGENAWLLIMAVVLYFVESIKKKRKSV